MTPKCTHSMQNPCRTASILVHECPLSDLFFEPFSGQNPGLKQAAPAVIPAHAGIQRATRRNDFTTKSAKTTKVISTDVPIADLLNQRRHDNPKEFTFCPPLRALRSTNIWFLVVAQRFYMANLLSFSALASLAAWRETIV